METIEFDVLAVQEVCSKQAVPMLCTFGRRAHMQGWPQARIDAVLTEAISKDYDHLVAVLAQYSRPVTRPPQELTPLQAAKVQAFKKCFDGYKVVWEDFTPVFVGYNGNIETRKTL